MYPPISEKIVKIITHINKTYDDIVSFLKNKIESKAETRTKSKKIIDKGYRILVTTLIALIII